MVGASSTPHGQACLEMGRVSAEHGIKLKVMLYNSGPRAAFVRTTCRQLDGSTLLPDGHAHLAPSCLVLAPHGTEQVVLYYRPERAEEEKCRLGKSPLACLVLETGDELVRQRLVWGMKKKAVSHSDTSPTHEEFTSDFTHQEKATSG